MDNRLIWKFILSSLIIMLLFPVITNWLMFVGNFKVAGDDKTWIGFLGSFCGAIIGGIISGTITLMGVRLTIQSQKNEEFMRIYPQLMLYGDEITASLKHFLEEVRVEDFNSHDVVYTVKKYHELSAELLVKAGNINGFVYENYKNIHGYFYYFNKYLNDLTSYDNEWGRPEYDFDKTKIQHYIRLISNDLKKHEDLISEISNSFFYITVVDRVPKKWKRWTRKNVDKVKKKLEK
ncbi:hypothetical protein ACQKML_13740 [Peribacillus frigoritolerans]